MRIPIQLLVSLIILSQEACRTPNSGSDVKHDAATPTFGSDQFLWAPVTYDEFRTAQTRPPFKVGQALDDTAPLVKRLQYWADRFHAAVVADFKVKYPSKNLPPKPFIKVVPSKNPNAWASGVPVCPNGAVTIETPVGTTVRNVGRIELSAGRLQEPLSFLGQPAPKCVTPTSWPKGEIASKAFIKWFNDFGGPAANCKLAYKAGQFVVKGMNCVQDNPATLATRADTLSVLIPSNFIHITSAYLAMMKDERSVVRVLAHELGHYYRGHVTSELLGLQFNYWYQQTQPPKAGKPAPLSDSGALATTFTRVLPYARPEVPGQKLSMELTDFVLDWLGGTELPKACTGSCACSTALASRTSDMVAALSCFGCSHVAQAQAVQYLKYEQELLACSGSIEVEGSTTGLNKIAYSTFVKRINDDSRLKLVVGTPPTSGNLLTILNQMNTNAMKMDAERQAFHKTLKDRIIGHYTVEQEADDFAIEHLARTGIEPAATLSLELDLYEKRYVDDPGAFERNTGLTLARCRQLLADEWREPLPPHAPIFVPIGSLFDPHHGACYRVYNASQELKAHSYVIAPSPPIPAIPWSEFVVEAQKITDGFSSGPGRMMQSQEKRQGVPTAGNPAGLPQALIIDGF